MHFDGLIIVPALLQWLIHECCLNHFVGSGKGSGGSSKVSLDIPITLVPGRNTIDLLSLTVGLQVLLHFIQFVASYCLDLKNLIALRVSFVWWKFSIFLLWLEIFSTNKVYNAIYQNYGAFFELRGAGVTGPVKLESQNNNITVDLSSEQWTYQVGFFKHPGVELSNPERNFIFYLFFCCYPDFGFIINLFLWSRHGYQKKKKKAAEILKCRSQ